MYGPLPYEQLFYNTDWRLFMLKQRGVVEVIILTLVTCGIYGLYWVYDTMSGFEQTTGKESGINAVACLLLCLFLGSIGYLLFGMEADEQLNMIKESRGIPTTDNKVMYMLLGFFLPIVLIPIIQDEINKLA